MPTRFYDDLLRSADGLLDQNMDPRDEPTKHQVVSVTANASKCCTVSHEKAWQHEWKRAQDAEGKDTDNWSRVESEKSSSTVTCNKDGWKMSSTFANDKFAFKAAGEALDVEGWNVRTEDALEHKPAKNEWKFAPKFNITSPDFSGIRAFLNLHGEFTKTGDADMAKKMVAKLNLSHEDEHHIGVWHQDDKGNKKNWVQLAWTPKDGTYWARCDMARKLFHSGCHQSNLHGKDIDHSYEIEYNWEKDNKDGLRNTPVSVRAGVEYGLSDKTSLAANFLFSGAHSMKQEVTHKADSHWTLGMWQEFNSENKTAGGPPAYHTGFTLNYRV